MSNKEYGGYIEFEYFYGKEYHEGALALNSGRHGMEYLIRAKGIKKVYLPFFLCDSVADICKKNNVVVEYYHIGEDFRPAIMQRFCDNEWLYIVNYYGQIPNEEIDILKGQYGNIIVDNIQAFFQHPVSGVDTIYSCRKFFGVADGGYLYTDSRIENIERDYSYDKMSFLFGRLEKTATEFYSDYVANNKKIAEQDVKFMSKTTQNIMCGLNYETIKKKRTENYDVLREYFSKINKLNLLNIKGAFMYPLFIDNGVRIRKMLQDEKIYIPTLWPDAFKHCERETLEYQFAENILPLPVDQRYNKSDMQHIIERIVYYM